MKIQDKIHHCVDSEILCSVCRSPVHIKDNQTLFSLTGWAVVGSVVSELGQAVKVLLAVITREDGVVVHVVLVIPVIAVIVLLWLSVFSDGPLILLGFSVRRRNV